MDEISSVKAPREFPSHAERLTRHQTALLEQWAARLAARGVSAGAAEALRVQISALFEALVDGLRRGGPQAETSRAAGRQTPRAAESSTDAPQAMSALREVLMAFFATQTPRLELEAEMLVHAIIDLAIARAARAATPGAAEVDASASAAAAARGDMAALSKLISEQQLEAGIRELFMGVLGHDLRQPLATISMAASMLLTSEGADEATTRLAKRIARSTERMSRMIDALLDLTRSRAAGGITLETARIDLQDLVWQVVEEFEISAPERRILCTFEGDTIGEWDGDRLSQVISNLLKNAIDYSPKTTPITVSVTTARSGPGAEARDEPVVLTVHNHGAPIPEEARKTLFEPFHRSLKARRSDNAAGLGLGLFIAQQIVQAHGGQMAVSSEEERGTRVIVRLPRGRG